jgi:protein phosphatase
VPLLNGEGGESPKDVVEGSSGDLTAKPGENAQARPDNFCFRVSGLTDVGRVRDVNEDSFYIDKKGGLFMVSDGMGGHSGGAFASRIVTEVLPPMLCEQFGDRVPRSAKAIKKSLKRVVAKLNNYMLKQGYSLTGLTNMGATVVAGFFVCGRFYFANVGDSRAYLFRKGRLRQLTSDHSVVGELVEKGDIDAGEELTHPAAGQLTRYIGIDSGAQADVKSLTVKRGDSFLLCSDGLSDLVSDEQIAEVMGKLKDAGRCCERLVEMANEAGGFDNITSVIVHAEVLSIAGQ